MKKRFLVTLSMLFLANCIEINAEKPNITKFQPTVESLLGYECPEWFRDAKFGIWSHWGPQTVPMHCNGWYAREMYMEGYDAYKYHLANYGHPSKFGYKDIIQLWKAEKFDPEYLMTLYKDAGAKYFVALANHHDNFDLWNSKYQPRWNSVNMGPKKDIVKLWQQAALKNGLRFGVTQHLERCWSWFQTNKGADKTGPYTGVPYDGNDPAYQDLYLKKDPNGDDNLAHPKNATVEWRQNWLARTKDLIDQFHPDLMYVDGGIPFSGDDKGQTGLEMVSYLYNTSKDLHGGRNEAVMCNKDVWAHGYFWDGIATLDLERTNMNQIHKQPWIQDNSTGPWFYDLGFRNSENGTMYYSADKIISELVDVVSKNGTMLLNVTQLPDGSLDSTAIVLLKDIGKWMKINGQAIYATRPWKSYGEDKNTKAVTTVLKDFKGSSSDKILKFTSEDIRFTQSKDGKTLFAMVMSWPTNGKVLIKSLATPIGIIKNVSLLGSKSALKWQQTENGLVVTFPTKKPCDHVYALKINGKNICK